jgi:hypothetical protein
MLPENCLGAVGKVVVAVGGRGHGLEHGLFPYTPYLILQEQRRSIAESLKVVSLLLSAVARHRVNAHGFGIEGFQIFSEYWDGQFRHDVLDP